MNVNNINPYQGLQNAYLPDNGNDSSAENREVSSVSQGKSNLTDVYDPPFFPIARYQRQDLIKKVKSVVAEVERPAADQKLQNTPLVDESKISNPDAGKSVTPEKIQPGSILSIKI
jgi:hypothetical protein